MKTSLLQREVTDLRQKQKSVLKTEMNLKEQTKKIIKETCKTSTPSYGQAQSGKKTTSKLILMCGEKNNSE